MQEPTRGNQEPAGGAETVRGGRGPRLAPALLWAAALWPLGALWLRRSASEPLWLGRYSPRLLVFLLAASLGLAGLAWLDRRRGLSPRLAGWLARHRGVWLLAWLVGGLALLVPCQYYLPDFLAGVGGGWLLAGLGLLAARRSGPRERLTRPRLKGLLLNAALSLLMTALCLVAAEYGFRYWLRHYAAAGIANVCDPRTADQATWFFAPHHYLNYAPRPGWVSADGRDCANSSGFRGPREVALPKPPGTLRLAALGGSTTYSSVAAWQDSYPHQLELALKEKHGRPGVEVINAGVPGYDSYETLLNLQFRVLDTKPDWLVIYQGTNDVHARLAVPAHYRGDNSARRRQWDQIKANSWPYDSHSAILRFLAERTQLLSNEIDALVQGPYARPGLESDARDPKLGLTPLEALDRNPPVYFERNLKSQLAIARAHGCRVLLVTFAFRPEAGGYAGTAFHARAVGEHNAITRALADQPGVHLYDLAAAMPRDPAYWGGDGIHYTPAGNRKRAELIAEFLVSRGLL